MLTRNDVTIPNALETLEEVKGTGLECIGCKDIPLKLDEYIRLFGNMKSHCLESFLEIVTYDEQEHFRGVNLGLKIGADHIIGGMPEYTKATLDYLKTKKSEIGFYPYIGEVVDHPCILQGSIDDILKDGREAERLGVNGVNLLLYRYVGNQEALLTEVVEKLRVPVIIAGNIRNFEQIQAMKRKDIWAFTIGSAIFNRAFVKGRGIREQIVSVLNKLTDS
jgi:hypothetical protein